MAITDYLPGNKLPLLDKHQWVIHIHVDPNDLAAAQAILQKVFKDDVWFSLDTTSLMLENAEQLDGSCSGSKIDHRLAAVQLFLEGQQSYEALAALKEKLLLCWQALQQQNINLSYQVPGNDRAITLGSCEFPTPFSYSARFKKNYQSTLAIQQNYNPEQLSNPLEHFHFTHKNIKKFKIKYNPIAILESTIHQMTAHAEIAQLRLEHALHELAQQGNADVNKLKSWLLSFDKFYQEYSKERARLSNELQATIERSRNAFGSCPIEQDRQNMVAQYKELIAQLYKKLAKLEDDFEKFCGPKYFKYLGELRNKPYDNIQIYFAFDQIEHNFFEGLSKRNSLFYPINAEGIFSAYNKDKIKQLNWHDARYLYNRQLHIFYEQAQIERLKCLLEIFNFIQKHLQSYANPFMRNGALLYPKQYVLENLIHQLNVKSGTGVTIKNLVDEWQTTVCMKESDTNAHVHNKTIIAQHRNLFFAQDRDKKTSTEVFVEHLVNDHGNFRL